MLKQKLWAKILMVQWWLWRSEKAVSMSMLFLWNITEIMATITLIGCTDNECNPRSPWKQSARKQGEERSWSWLNRGSAHEPARRASLGRCFGVMGTHELPGLSSFHPENSQWQNSQPLPSSSSPSPSPPSPSHQPGGLQGRLYQWVSCYPWASDFPWRGLGSKPVFLHYSSP